MHLFLMLEHFVQVNSIFLFQILQNSDDGLDSTEDVSKELRQIMDISSEQETSQHSTRHTIRPGVPLPPQGGEFPLSGSGESPLSMVHRGGGVGESPASSPRLLRPGGARRRSGSLSPLPGIASPPSQPRRNTIHVSLGLDTSVQEK